MSASRRTGTAVLGGANDGTRLRTILARWAECDWLRPLDFAFAEFLWREVPDAPPLLILAAALASHQLGRGHACLDLQATLKDPSFALSLPPEGMTTPDSEPPPRPADVLKGLTLSDWLAAVTHPELVGSGAGATPLVLIGPRLYLRRYWAYEQAVRHGIKARLDGSMGLQMTLPIEAMRLILNRLFPDQSATRTDWQKLACALAARSAFSIITGGPGTGKTTTVVRLLALLQALALAEPPVGRAPRPLRIRLAAPTGKAAARLNASIADTVAGLPLDGLANAAAVRAAIPVTVTTLHRLLGSRSDTRHLRHHADNPLALDVLVIDEASMIDLELMAAVLDALPPRARLILLGDKDQLASVEAGAVLGELCRRAGEGHYHPATRDWLAAATGETLAPALIDPAGTALDQAIVMLRHSHRFAAAGGIGQLAAAVNAGDTAAALRIWNGRAADLGLVELADQDEGAFRSLVIDGKVTGHGAVSAASARPNATSNTTTDGYRHYLEMLRNGQPTGTADPRMFDTWARAVLEAHGQFQVLCALRRGPWGVDGLNQRIAGLLHAAGLIPASVGWYLGRPVLVTRNDYGLGLMNGDIGITLVRPDGVADRLPLRVAFPAADGNNGITWVLPSRLQAVETVYALTVHKSQGSEFTHAALVMPEQPSPVLTRELIYTGITRARVQLTLVRPGDNQVLAAAIKRRVLRASGLMEEH